MPTGTAAGCRDMETGAYRYQRHQPKTICFTGSFNVIIRHSPPIYSSVKAACLAKARELARAFKEHFRPFKDMVSKEVKNAGPRV